MSGDMETLPPMSEDEQIELLALAFAATFGRDVSTDADRFVAIDMLRLLQQAGAEIARQA